MRRPPSAARAVSAKDSKRGRRSGTRPRGRFGCISRSRPLEHATEPANLHVDRARLDVFLRAPNAVDDLAARVHTVRLRHEIAQQAESDRSENDGWSLAVTRMLALSRRKPSISITSLASARRYAPKHGLDSREQLVARERLRDIVVRAGAKSVHAITLVAAASHDDHRHRTRALRAAPAVQELQPVDVGQARRRARSDPERSCRARALRCDRLRRLRRASRRARD